MIHSRLEGLFCALEEANLSWCAMRIPVNPGKSTGDVDLLLDPADAAGLRRVMKLCEFVELPGWKPGLHFLSYHQLADQWIWIHLVTELSFGPRLMLKTNAAGRCLSRRQRSGRLFVLNPDDAFWELLLHCVLDKGSIAPCHRIRLQALTSETCLDSPLAQAVAKVCPPGWSTARVVEDVRSESWVALERVAPIIAARWMGRLSIGMRHRLAHRALWIRDSLRNLQRRRGLSVAVLGPDGAGKSTLVMGIEESFVFPVRSIYMGLTGGLLVYVTKLRLPGVVLTGRLLIFWSRYLKAQYHQARGRLVVFERYNYDGFVPHPDRLNWLQRKSRWIDARACPGPDVVLVLNARGSIMYERKREYSAEMLEDWRQHFLALQFRFPNVEIVDASRGKDVVRADVINRIWQRYVARWSGDQDKCCPGDSD